MRIGLNNENFAWAAGFFDGEANFFHQLKKGHDRFIIQIGQKDRQVLDRLVSIFPGSKVTGPYEHRGKYRFPKKSFPYYYRWSIQDFEYAQYVVCCVWNWLSDLKRQQITIALTNLREKRNSFKCQIHEHNQIALDKRGNPFCRSCRSTSTYVSWVTRRGNKKL